ncbi:MAG: hypothetical protein N5P05_002800 [Chroococcopsis gigantea SAG 12.99]|jgi:hypothetical protein|nr:phycobilisome protein [Chlorogloea purpurea SAG 13.99]MDV3001194.1 hypothetical protein [Chroococcopsis gigantea SAG 12.99]
MQTDLENYWHMAENHYLNKNEVAGFKKEIGILKQRLSLYETLRDKEITILQAVADRVEVQDDKMAEKAFQHWIATLRYCAMAMLLNNPEFLSHRLLEWLTDIVQSYEIQGIEAEIVKELEIELKTVLSLEDYGLISPFLDQAKNTLINTSSTSSAAAVI